MILGEQVKNESIAVGTTAIILLEENPSGWQVFIIKNTSTAGQNITLSFGKSAITNAGVVLAPQDVYLEAYDGYFIPCKATISAISSAAGGNVSIYAR